MDLAQFFYHFGIGTTTNFDLYDIAKVLDLPIKICMKDEFKELLQKSKKNNYIINLQDSDENGTHWVSFSKDQLIYFDSYGIKPLKEIEELSDKVVYNTIQIQPYGFKFCGQLCLYILYNKNIPFEHLIVKTYNEVISLLE